jgi:glycosyltransferase involved in cell wall biosynthesis
MKILAFGDSIRLPTGYGVVSKHVLSHFVKKGHDVKQIAWGHAGPDINMQVNNGGDIPAGYILLRQPHTPDPFGTQSTFDYINSWKPDVVYNSNDYFTIIPLLGRKKEMSYQNSKYVNYGVIDGPGSALAFKDVINQIDIPVVPSQYGFKQIEEFTNKAFYIPHGVDLNIYKPLDKLKAKELFGLQDKFVFGAVNRNVWRKHYPLLLKAFSRLKFKHNLKDITLFIVTDPRDQYGHDINSWAKLLNLSFGNDIHTYTDIMYHPMFVNSIVNLTDEQLNTVYNTFDVYISASMSEGFGLPTLESQAAGVPSILCDHSANTELVKDHGWLYSTLKNLDGSEAEIYPNTVNATYTYPMPDIVDLERCMLDAYNNRDKLDKFSEDSYEFAIKYKWEDVLPLWDEVLKRAETKEVS